MNLHHKEKLKTKKFSIKCEIWDISDGSSWKIISDTDHLYIDYIDVLITLGQTKKRFESYLKKISGQQRTQQPKVEQLTIE